MPRFINKEQCHLTVVITNSEHEDECYKKTFEWHGPSNLLGDAIGTALHDIRIDRPEEHLADAVSTAKFIGIIDDDMMANIPGLDTFVEAAKEVCDFWQAHDEDLREKYRQASLKKPADQPPAAGTA